MNPSRVIALGVAAVLVETALWHGPLGAADRLAARIEAAAAAEIKHQEMFGVTARLERAPLRRRMVLTGPADEFQQRGLGRLIDNMPGVSGTRWTTPPGAPIKAVP